MIRIRYDREADALAVQFRDGARSRRTIRVTDTVYVDIDARGRVITVEVIDASAQLPKASLDDLPTADDELTLAEAARESGLTAGTLRVLLNRGRLAGRKRGRDWYVDATALVNYLESREASGRPASNPKARRSKPRPVAAR